MFHIVGQNIPFIMFAFRSVVYLELVLYMFLRDSDTLFSDNGSSRPAACAVKLFGFPINFFQCYQTQESAY